MHTSCKILHDWSDEKCIEILSNLRQAMKVRVCGSFASLSAALSRLQPGAMLLVVDRLLHKGVRLAMRPCSHS